MDTFEILIKKITELRESYTKMWRLAHSYTEEGYQEFNTERNSQSEDYMKYQYPEMYLAMALMEEDPQIAFQVADYIVVHRKNIDWWK